MNAGELCLGVDIGGTFTDCVLSDGTRIWRAKSPTTPGALGQGVLAAANLVAERRGASLTETLPLVMRFGLGTTAVTNVLASGTGRKVGLLATAGFEEMLLYARGARIVDEDGWIARPGQIVDKHAIAPIQERIDRHGDVLTALDADEVERAARRMINDEGIEAIAVSFLWSFLNPVHEDEAVAVIRGAYPDMTVVSSAELHPAAREYERTSFAVLNAYVSGALGGIEDLETDLRDLGLSAPLLLVHSGGGSMTVREARRRPLGLAVSGPAAGVAAAVTVASTSGADDLITCDMGGTSFDVSIIANGEPARRTRGDLMGVWTALSLVDVESIGAGGGSLGWIDARGMMRVGPQSAGAVPGPACYGRGGTDATVTDALVVLGYIDPNRFLGGDFELDAGAARTACARLGEPLGLDADETAWGIRELALAGMVKATRARTGALGLDPREHALLSFGGSGALFTPDIAAAIGAPTVLVPELASVLSAFGAATTDIRRERLRAVLMKVPGDPSLIEKLITELATAVRADLAADGVAPDAQSVSFEADVRFFKQSYELQIPFTDPVFNADTMDRVVDAFRAEYTKRYGHGSVTLGVPIELIAVRAIGVGHTTQAELQHRSGNDGSTPAEPVGTRSVRLARNTGGPQVVPTFDGPTLQPGHTITGPALIDGSDTTIWLPSDAHASVDPFGTLVMEVNS